MTIVGARGGLKDKAVNCLSPTSRPEERRRRQRVSDQSAWLTGERIAVSGGDR